VVIIIHFELTDITITEMIAAVEKKLLRTNQILVTAAAQG